MGKLSQRSVVLTGASEGIGRALALELAGEHTRLTLIARNPERLEAVAQECRQKGAEVLTVSADVAQRAQCEAAVKEALNHFGGIDILVNNAGITMWSRFDQVSDLGALEQVMAVNYFGSVYMTAAALPALKQSRGLIVAVASVAGLTGVPERTGYAASKHAMIGFFESLRIEVRNTGVDVTIIAPDFVVSQIHRRAIGPDGKPLGKTPMQEARIMTAEECARRIRRAMEKRQRLLITSTRGRLGRIARIFVPKLVDRIAERAIQRRS